ncbi:MAG: MFS transporter, partial [Alphaproteobacteria bacterium]|nr:MFS transporter [Alphaproteobacteria bacterium]
MKFQKEIFLTLSIVWPLLLGMFMVMVGSGLQGTLLSLRADFEGFPLAVIGIIMSMYYVGYLGGWYIVPTMINKVGYIRVFSGFASMASTTVLLQGVFINPFAWAIVRFMSGVSFVGLFIVAESWLNDIAPNRLRGRIFSSYMLVVHGGLFAGQFLINLAPIQNIGLFVLVSVLVSLSLIPVTLASKVSEFYEEPESLEFKKVIGISQHAVMAVLVAGFSGASMLAIGPVYAAQLGFAIGDISIFLASFILGCATLPLFAGWLSDRFGRRIVLIGAALIGTLVTGIN